MKLVAEKIRTIVRMGGGSMISCQDHEGADHTLCLSNEAERALIGVLLANPPEPPSIRHDHHIEPTRVGVLRAEHVTLGISLLLGDRVGVHVTLPPQALKDLRKAVAELDSTTQQ